MLLWVLVAATVTVAADGSGDFRTVQAAVDAAPAAGSVIRIRPGKYQEVVVVKQSGIQLRGTGASPSDVVLSCERSAADAGGTGKSACTTITGSDFYAENLTFENTFSRTRALTQQGSQAVALRVTGDRAVFRKTRFLGYQDTLYADHQSCESDAGPCVPARQYFSGCYVEGNVDFIFGDALAVFEDCEIHALAHPTVMITAQSKRYADQKSGYVFDRCHISAAEGATRVYLGRPWRAYSQVVFLNTEMPAEIVPEGWAEWLHDGKPSLPTVFYAEYNSWGAGATMAVRDPHSRKLSVREAARFTAKEFLKGDDGWNPTEVH